MLLLIIIPTILFIWGIISAISDRDADNFFFISIFGALGCGVCTVLIAALIGLFIPSNEIIYEETVTPIVALEDNMTSSGTFFLGTGSAKDSIYYYYMIETERGYALQSVAASKTYIKYDTKPRIVIENGCGFKHWYNNIWAFPTHTRYTIYIPEGTILNNYNIDLK